MKQLTKRCFSYNLGLQLVITIIWRKTWCSIIYQGIHYFSGSIQSTCRIVIESRDLSCLRKWLARGYNNIEICNNRQNHSFSFSFSPSWLLNVLHFTEVARFYYIKSVISMRTFIERSLVAFRKETLVSLKMGDISRETPKGRFFGSESCILSCVLST